MVILSPIIDARFSWGVHTVILVDGGLWHDGTEDNRPLHPRSSCTDLGDRT